MPACWEKALDAAAGALRKAGGRRPPRSRAPRRPTRRPSSCRGCSARAWARATSRARPARALPADLCRALADPALQATVPDLEFAHAVLVLDCDPVDDAPILDLRLRKGVRRRGVKPRGRRARAPARWTRTPRPCCASRPAAARRCSSGSTRRWPATTATSAARPPRPARTRSAVRQLAEFLSGAGEDVVILYGERLLAGPRGAAAARALLNVAARLGLAGRDGAGLLEIPASANGRGMREAGFAGGARPGLRPIEGEPLGARASPRRWPTAALERALPAARRSAAHARRPRASGSSALGRRPGRHRPRDDAHRHAARARRRRLPRRGLRGEGGHARAPRRPRPAPAPARSARPGGALGEGVRAGWQVIAEVARRAGHDLGVLAGPMASRSSSPPCRSTPG